MQAKEMLNRPWQIQHKIDGQKKAIERWNELSLSVSSPQFDREIVSGPRNLEAPFLKWIYKIMDMEKLIEEEMVELNDAKQTVKKEVSAYVEDPDSALVLIKRYVELLPFEEISQALGLRNTTMYRLHRAGIEAIEKGGNYGSD